MSEAAPFPSQGQATNNNPPTPLSGGAARLQIRLSADPSASSSDSVRSPSFSVGGGCDLTSTAGVNTTSQQAASTSYYTPRKNPTLNSASTANLTLLHQCSSLFYSYNVSGRPLAPWSCEGTTTMYLVHDSNEDNSGDSSTTADENNKKKKTRRNLRKELGIHLRGGSLMKVESVVVQTPFTVNNAVKKAGTELTTSNDSHPLPTTAAPGTTTTVTLKPIPATFEHHDPLSKVLTKPAKTFSSHDWQPSSSTRRFEADSQCSRAAPGMTDALRSASLASNLGELRLVCMLLLDSNNGNGEGGREEVRACWRDSLLTGSSNDDCEDGIMHKKLQIQLHERGGQKRLNRIALIANKLTEASHPPQPIPVSTESSTTTATDASPVLPSMSSNTSTAMKITIRFSVSDIPNGPIHLGGIHYHSPLHLQQQTVSCTPHVYTICGNSGDHQGTRCWLPTLDSSNSKHRSSHEISIRVTAGVEQGLWCGGGCGEDFGVYNVALHPSLCCSAAEPVSASGGRTLVVVGEAEERNNLSKETVKHQMVNVLGARHVRFISSVFGSNHGNTLTPNAVEGRVVSTNMNINRSGNVEGTAGILAGNEASRREGSGPHVIPPDQRVVWDEGMRPELATALWATCIWAPCPSRSLGFAIGPFKTIYDPEYYSPDDDDDEEEESGSGSNAQLNDTAPTIAETALKHGEGIRQLYFAPVDERARVHALATVILNFADHKNQRQPLDSDQYQSHLARTGGAAAKSANVPLSIRQRKHQIEQSIIGSTAGVTNRALSLMRDVLSLPSYRTSSFTQIWIPNAVDGGSSSGTLNACPEVMCNPFLGGAILDSTLLPPPGRRLPYHSGGRVLQFLQARCAIRGWITSALPLGGKDDVGQGYLLTLFESFIMSLYERGHGACGEGGGKTSFYFSKRYGIGSGLNSPNLDFLPVMNVEEEELDLGLGLGGMALVGAVPVEERSNEQLWRSASNGTESHTSSLDEYSVRQLLSKDVLEAMERVDKSVALPSMGWLGSHLSATFLASNTTSSSDVGCGALELVHATGLAYRNLKCDSLRKIIEGRAGISNFVRVMRAAFIAAILEDNGETKLHLPDEKINKMKVDDFPELMRPRPPFLVCIDELIKKSGLTHTLFTRALRIMAGPLREPYLRGSLADVGREIHDPRSNRHVVEAEGFPNSFVRGASGLYLRVGSHVESAGISTGDQHATSLVAAKGFHLHVIAEPAIPEGGCSFGGPITLRVVENEGQVREFVRTLRSDGSRCDWGPIFLLARPVTTAHQQTAASGAIEAGSGSSGDVTSRKGPDADESRSGDSSSKNLLGTPGGSFADSVFNADLQHNGGYQALELIRLTNRTPLLWVKVDPHSMYNGRISVFMQDACLSEQLFHDGEASSQVEAMRSLAERPLKLQGSVKINSVYDAKVSELPVRVIGDCLRGTPALHADLPHNPAIRAQAALTIAQWQNNKAPNSRDAVGADAWVGLNLLIQYFKERFYALGSVMPVKYSRVSLKKKNAQSLAERAGSGGNQAAAHIHGYLYLDTFTEMDERAEAIEKAAEVEIEEDEEHRVRASVITAIASIRAKDGMTPPAVLRFLETILKSGDEGTVVNLITPEESILIKKKRTCKREEKSDVTSGSRLRTNAITEPERDENEEINNIPFVASALLADALLSLCYVNCRPALSDDPVTGTQVQSKANHPCLPLMEACHRWLMWDLYREDVRMETEIEFMTGIGGNCYATVSACAITALSSLAILKQCTTDTPPDSLKPGEAGQKRKTTAKTKFADEAATAQFYVDIFDSQPHRSDTTRAAAAQAVACLCCAADRLEELTPEPTGFLTAMEFMLDRIVDQSTSPGLRQTLAALMLDASTGKVCSMQRVASIGGRNDLYVAGARYMNGPLGASNGGDNGISLLTTVSEFSLPAASTVNDGARRGLRLLSRAGRDTGFSERTVVRVARFATNLWRTINGELGAHSSLLDTQPPSIISSVDGACANDGHLRCALLSIWQWIWSKHCFALIRVHSWKSHQGTQRYKDLGAEKVMKQTDEEKEAAAAEEFLCSGLRSIVSNEIDRQLWRGEMAAKSYEYCRKEDANSVDATGAAAQGLGQPLPVVEKDIAWSKGGWISSAAFQRRAMGVDGGTAVTKVRLTVKGGND